MEATATLPSDDADSGWHRHTVGRRVTARLRVLPDFLVVGAMKAGTTSLYHDLLRHPQVLGANRKEVHFFDPANRGCGDLWYRAHFPSIPRRLAHRLVRGPNVVGEASPSYLLDAHAPAEAAALLRDARIIVLLRDPVERAFSQYHHQRRRGIEYLDSFEAAVDAEPERLAGEWERHVADPHYVSIPLKKFSYALRSIYLPQLQRWEEAFPREHMLVLHSADYERDPAAALRQIAAFMDLRPWGAPSLRRNVGGYRDAIAASTRATLDEVFRPHNRALFEHLGRDFGWPA